MNSNTKTCSTSEPYELKLSQPTQQYLKDNLLDMQRCSSASISNDQKFFPSSIKVGDIRKGPCSAKDIEIE